MGDPSTPTIEQQRRAIDEGRTRDKIAFPDPAAAPLGTDAEASGNPPTEEERRLEAAAQQPLAPVPRNARWPVLIHVAAIAIVAMLILIIARFWR